MGKNRGKKRRKNRRGAFAESWRPPALLVWEGFLVSDSLLFNRKSPKIDSFIVFLCGLMCLEWWHGVKIGSFCVCCWDLIGIWCFFGGWTGIPVDCFAFVLFWLLLNGFDPWKLKIVFLKNCCFCCLDRIAWALVDERWLCERILGFFWLSGAGFYFLLLPFVVLISCVDCEPWMLTFLFSMNLLKHVDL